MARLKELLKQLGIVVVVTLLSLAVLEFGLRTADIPPEPEFGWKWDRSPYKSAANSGDGRVNELGLRGRPIAYDPNDFVILLVGDSYVEAGMQVYEDMPEQILESLLRNKYGFDHVRVFSVASAGWGQDQELLWLGYYFSRFRANLVLMWLTPINDYWENSNVDRNISRKAGPLKPTFQLAKDNNLELAYPRQSRFKLRLLVERALARLRYRGEAGPEQLYTDQWLQKLPPSNITPVSRLLCPSTEVEQAEVVASFRNGAPQITAVTTEDVADGRSHFSHFLVPTSMRERYQIEITHRLIEATARLSQERGAAFRAFFPQGSDIDKALAAVKCVKDGAAGNYYATDFSDAISDLRSSPLQKLLLTVDISSRTPNVISNTDWHLNRDGNFWAMDAVAQQLLAGNLLHNGVKP
jgi:hypothetical protein